MPNILSHASKISTTAAVTVLLMLPAVLNTMPLNDKANAAGGTVPDTGAVIAADQGTATDWTGIQPKDFIKVKELSGDICYYSVEPDIDNISMIRAHYLPPGKIVKLGYKLSDTCTGVKKLEWDWRIITPPRGSNENIPGKNDSGASVYLIFNINMQTFIIKYVYSETLPAGMILKKDPLYPLQRMFIVVKNSIAGSPYGNWQHVAIDVESDFKRLFKSRNCPPLKGIGIMSDGDETSSCVMADYKNFRLLRDKMAGLR